MKSPRNTEPGFTLLELLAAMAVLAVMIVMLFAAFSQASRAWLQAENRVETFTQGRVVLDLMARELSQAIATTNISFLGNATSVAFIAPISANAGDVVDLEEVVYQWNNGTLTRQVTPASAGAAWDFYFNPQNWPADSTSIMATVADNVVSLSLSYVNTNGTTESFWNSTVLPGWSGIPSGASAAAPWAMTNRPPAGVLIAIDTIDSRTATKLLAIITPPGVVNASNITPYTNLINQVKKSFTTFVAIPNGHL